MSLTADVNPKFITSRLEVTLLSTFSDPFQRISHAPFSSLTALFTERGELSGRSDIAGLHFRRNLRGFSFPFSKRVVVVNRYRAVIAGGYRRVY